MKPMDIEKESFRIIESELPRALPEKIKPIVMRAIHATADFSYAEDMHFTPGVVGAIHDMMRRGCAVITDTEMAKSGINKKAAAQLGLALYCFMSDAEVAAEAEAGGVTRAHVSMGRALALRGPRLFVCGNAPTFLMRLVASGIPDDAAAIGLPVGFVNVIESKRQLIGSGIPAICNTSRRGGSNVAAAVVNALMYGVVSR